MLGIVELTEPMGEQELRTVQFFRGRLAELERNWSELENEGFTVSGWLGRDADGKIATTGVPVSIHRLKGLYVDFRFFWGDKEPSNFFKIERLIGKHCNTSTAVTAALKANKKQWQDAGGGNRWHGLDTDEMIRAIFYGSIIHEAEDKQAALEQVNSVLSEPAAHHILASTIWARTYPLRSLDWMLSPLREDRQVVQVPDCFA